MSVNKVILVGHVGKDPEIRYLDSDTPFCKISLATSEVYKNKSGERVETTEWHNVILWRGRAEVAEKYIKKGSQIYIEGRLRTRSWDDKDKIKRYTTEIVADVLQILGRRIEEHVAAKTNGTAHPTENSPSAGHEDNHQSSEGKIDIQPATGSINTAPGAYSAETPPAEKEDDLPF